MKNSEKTLDMIVNLCKNRGFIYPGSEIYGGLANSWDYGPLGVEFKNNVKKAWMKKFVQESPYNVGLDAAILMNPQTWVTTGHVGNFSDPLVDCRACKSRNRADKLIADCEQGQNVDVDGMTFDQMDEFIATHPEVVCPVCGKHDFTPIRKFNLMFKTAIGVTEDSSSTCYLRPETAQGIFVNFANIQRTTRRKLPFGVCQVGKAFRNEITPGNFTFRTREFEQMECEFFCKPGTDLDWFAYWKDYCEKWLLSLGINKENLRLRDHEPAELAFYSRATTDIEYAFPFTDWGELWGIADRTNYDLGRHQEASGKSLEYFDPETNEHYIPYVIEPSLGCDRVALAFLCEAYDEEHLTDSKGKEDVRTVLHLHPFLAPFKCAVLPLSKKLGDKAMEIRNELAKDFMVDYDDAGSIGKRYRRQDEIGTPLCITVDFQTVGDDKVEADGCVTVRDRDTTAERRQLGVTGVLRCGVLLKDDIEVIQAATALLAEAKLTPELQNEALYYRAKAYLNQKAVKKAADDLKLLAKDTRTLYGAEAKYLSAQLMYNAGEYAAAEKEILNFIDQSTPHAYWLARSFILLSDVYVAMDKKLDARQYLLSLQQNYHADDDIERMIQERLEKLK